MSGRWVPNAGDARREFAPVKMALALLVCQSRDEVFHLIGDFMTVVVPDATVIISEPTQDGSTLITRKIAGLDDKELAAVADLLGFDIVGTRHEVGPSRDRAVLGDGEFPTSAAVTQLVADEIPQWLAAVNLTAFGMRGVLALDIASGDRVLCSVHILTTAPDTHIPAEVIESFARNCCVALERIDAAAQLAEQAARNRQLIGGRVDGLALHEIIRDEAGLPCDYRFLEVNQAYETMTGLLAEEIVGRTVREVIPSIDPARIERYGLVAMTGVAVRFEDNVSESGACHEVVAYSPQPGMFATLISDVTKRNNAEAALREATVFVRREQVNTAALINSTNDLIWSVDEEFKLTTSNSAFLDGVKARTGRRPVRGESVLDESVLSVEQLQFWRRLYESVLEGQTVYTELHTPATDTEPVRWIELNANPIVHGFGVTGAACFARDVTQRKQAEMRSAIARDILHILNERHNEVTTLEKVVGALRLHTGFDAVGIRMSDGEDFPYMAQEGFSEDFLASENSLLGYDAEGGVCRDDDGNVLLECTCGLVLSGGTDPAGLFLTPGGSIWSSDFVSDSAALQGDDPRVKPRNRCVHEGYSSVALIPVRLSNRIVGLIQLCDQRKGCLDLGTVESLEGIATHLGAAMLSARTADELLVSEERHRASVQTAMDGFWLSDGNGRILEVNQAYCSMSGYSEDDLVGSLIADVTVGSSPEEIIARNESILAKGGDRFDARHRCKDGSVLEVEISSSYWSSGGGWFASFIRDVTVRNSTQAAMSLSRQQYHAVVETSPDGFLLLDGEGHVLEVNDIYMSMSGYSREELQGMHLFDLWVRSEEQATATMNRLADSGAQIFETEHRAKNGTCRLVEASVAHWPIDGGRFFVFVRDIVALRRAQQLTRVRAHLADIEQSADVDDLLRYALDQAEQLTDSSIAFFHFVDIDQSRLTLQMWSTNTLSTMCQAEHKGDHYSVDEAGVWADCVRSRSPLIHNDYASLPDRKGLPKGHAPVTRELVVPVIRAGALVAIMGVGNKLEDYTDLDTEIVDAIASSVVDLALRKRTEVELASFFELVPDMVCTVSADGTFHRVNAGWEQSLGYLPDDLAGEQFLDFVHPDDLEATRGQFHVLLHDEDMLIGFVNRYRTKDGSYRWVEWNAAKRAGGYIFAAARDITDRKAAETRDERYQERLRSLAAALAASEESERGRLGIELHDGVGQVLVAAKMTAQLLAAEPLEQTTQEQADKLVELLSESITETRLLTAELAPSVLFELGLESALFWLRDRYSQLYRLDSTIRVDAKSAGVRGESAMFAFRVVREGLNNVVRHSGANAAMVSIATDGEWRTLSVADDGVGFDTSLVDDPVDARGFGLFSVREQCVDRKGLFHISSTPGSGTQLTVRIPVDGAVTEIQPRD